MIIQYEVKGSGTAIDPYRCDLPEYNFISQISESPRVWEIEVPDNFGLNGMLVNEMIRQRYKYSKKQLDRIPSRERTRVEEFSETNYEAEQVIP